MKGQEQLYPVYGQSEYYGNTRKMDCDENQYSCKMEHPQGGKMDMPIAMAYVPWQQMRKVYTPKEGLCQGTIFPELNLSFCGERGVCR